MEKLISNLDLGRLNLFLRQDNSLEDYHRISSLPALEELFRGDRYYAILFKEWPGEAVGHWVLLTKIDEYRYEYFDCLGDPLPDEVTTLFSGTGKNILLETTSRKLMDPKGTICGKWVMFRLLCFPNSLQTFLKFIDSFRGKPDELVSFLINLPMKSYPA